MCKFNQSKGNAIMTNLTPSIERVIVNQVLSGVSESLTNCPEPIAFNIYYRDNMQGVMIQRTGTWGRLVHFYHESGQWYLADASGTINCTQWTIEQITNAIKLRTSLPAIEGDMIMI